MQIGAFALAFVILALTAGCDRPRDQSADVDAIEAIDNAVGELDEAFESRDAERIKTLMTADHVAVTHYYASPQSVDEQIASLPDLDYEQTALSEPTVTLLGPDVAIRTLTANLDGAYKGESITGKVFVTSIMVQQDGKWLERFYQVTDLEP